ncbi:MAG TPA: hypothetical protein VMM60_04805 [Ilumatobacter sp.]|nr:hypothetical protein [Ilumatobacter sp.]
MPARKRHRKAEEHRDPIVRFAEALKRTELREQKERERQAEAKEAAKRAAVHAEDLRLAKVELEQSIAKVKAARAARSGIAEADQLWQIAKARVIELETGTPPKWAAASHENGDDDDNSDDARSD